MQRLPLMRVVSDGTVAGTIIYNEKGERLGRVSRVEIEIDVKHAYPKMRLEMAGPTLDIKAQLVKIRGRKK